MNLGKEDNPCFLWIEQAKTSSDRGSLFIIYNHITISIFIVCFQQRGQPQEQISQCWNHLLKPLPGFLSRHQLKPTNGSELNWSVMKQQNQPPMCPQNAKLIWRIEGVKSVTCVVALPRRRRGSIHVQRKGLEVRRRGKESLWGRKWRGIRGGPSQPGLVRVLWVTRPLGTAKTERKSAWPLVDMVVSISNLLSFPFSSLFSSHKSERKQTSFKSTYPHLKTEYFKNGLESPFFFLNNNCKNKNYISFYSILFNFFINKSNQV